MLDFPRTMDYSPPGSSVHGILATILVHALLQGIFPIQRLKPHHLCLLHWQAVSLPLAPAGNCKTNPEVGNQWWKKWMWFWLTKFKIFSILSVTIESIIIIYIYIYISSLFSLFITNSIHNMIASKDSLLTYLLPVYMLIKQTDKLHVQRLGIVKKSKSQCDWSPEIKG